MDAVSSLINGNEHSERLAVLSCWIDDSGLLLWASIPYVKMTTDDDEDQSITSQDEALLEMLGLASPALIGEANEDVEDTTAPTKIPLRVRCDEKRTTSLFHHIALPRNVSRHFHKPEDCFAVTIPNLLSPAECQQLITLGRTGGFDYIRHAMHTAADGSQYQVELQNPNKHKLSVFQHSGWVDLLWQRIQAVLNTPMESSQPPLTDFLKRESVPAPTGLNPRLRVLQYDADDQDEFAPHFDATTRIGGQISLLTVLLYLNSGCGQDFEGGETYYLNAAMSTTKSTSLVEISSADVTRVTPQVGTVVIFEHDLFHSGHPLQWGTKYVLRTDLLFEISEVEWEQRPVKAALEQHSQKTSRSCLKSAGDSTSVELSNLITVESLVASLAQEEGWSTAHHDEVSQSLETLGMLDSSIESFCAPGRFALQLMLQDVLRGGKSATTERQVLVRQLVDQAFLCLQQARRK